MLNRRTYSVALFIVSLQTAPIYRARECTFSMGTALPFSLVSFAFTPLLFHVSIEVILASEPTVHQTLIVSYTKLSLV